MKSYLPLFALACLLLSSCGLINREEGMFRDRDKDYLKAGSLEPIKLPADVKSRPLEPSYPIPKVNALDDFGEPVNLQGYEVPLPEVASSDEAGFGVKIQSLHDRRWIFVGTSPSQVWPRVQSFLSSSGVDVSSADADAGLIESTWMQFKDEPDSKTRFRLMLEKGVHADTTEIHILQVGMPLAETPAEPFVWPDKSSSDKREEWFVTQLANYLAQTIDNSGASLLGQNVGGPLKSEFLRGAAEPTMRLRLPQDRAWASVVHSVKTGLYNEWESDQDLGVIYVDYSEDFVLKRGFFSKLAFWKSHKSRKDPAPYPLKKVLQHLSPVAKDVFDGKPGVAFESALKNSDGYLIVFHFYKDHSDVNIRDNRGLPLPRETAKQMLRELRKNLI